jgi:hypothetical protein
MSKFQIGTIIYIELLYEINATQRLTNVPLKNNATMPSHCAELRMSLLLCQFWDLIYVVSGVANVAVLLGRGAASHRDLCSTFRDKVGRSCVRVEMPDRTTLDLDQGK